MGGSVKQRGVGVAASVGLSEMGMPSFELGPGQGSHWKDRFPFSYSWNPWRWAVWDTLTECWCTDTFNFTRKPSRCLENGWERAWWPHDKAANRSPLQGELARVLAVKLRVRRVGSQSTRRKGTLTAISYWWKLAILVRYPAVVLKALYLSRRNKIQLENTYTTVLHKKGTSVT